MSNHTLHSMAEVIKVFGGQCELARFVGTSQQAVSNAVQRGTFPATWLDVMRAELLARGHSAPGALWRQLPVKLAVVLRENQVANA